MRRGQPPHPLNSDARQDATLAEAHDRYELVARFTTPSSERGLLLHDLAEQRAPSSAWPLRLRLQNVTAYRALLHNASEEPASTTAPTTGAGLHSRPAGADEDGGVVPRSPTLPLCTGSVEL